MVTDSKVIKYFCIFFNTNNLFFIGYLDDKFNLKHNIKFFIFFFYAVVFIN